MAGLVHGDQRLRIQAAPTAEFHSVGVENLLISAPYRRTHVVVIPEHRGEVAQHQQELGLEAALLEAGYKNAVVLVLGGAVTVMIAQEQLTDNASAQILALCVAHAGVGAENVRIMALTS